MRRQTDVPIRVGVSLVWILTFACLGPAFAQGESEPNDTCLTAQELGGAALPFELNGSLDDRTGSGDVDFFRFTGTPNAGVVALLQGETSGQGSLSDPFLGLFDSSCQILAADDDGGGGLDSRLGFQVPSDGVFVLAATSFGDFDFVGNPGVSGTYLLAVVEAIESIRGRVVDALTGSPLPGNDPPFAEAQLLMCGDFGCFELAFAVADEAGRFRFERDFNGAPLPSGTYQVLAFASEYRVFRTDPFEVAGGEEVDLGDLPLLPLPVRFSEIRPCGDLPPEGGVCSFSARLTNRLNEPLQGWSWSLVESFGIGSLTGFTQFQPGVRPMRLEPGQSAVARFRFHVPSTVQEGSLICARAFFGDDLRSPFFNTVGQKDLFCILKGTTGLFTVASDPEARELFHSLRGKGAQGPHPKKVPLRKPR